jgi:hypothetical protein
LLIAHRVSRQKQLKTLHDLERMRFIEPAFRMQRCAPDGSPARGGRLTFTTPGNFDPQRSLRWGMLPDVEFTIPRLTIQSKQSSRQRRRCDTVSSVSSPMLARRKV